MNNCHATALMITRSCRTGAARSILALAILVILAATPLTTGQVVTSAPSRPAREARPPLVLTIAGDLLYMKTADEVRARLVKVEDEGRPMVVLDLSVRRSRPDVVLELVRAVRACKVPVAVHIADANYASSMPTNLPATIGSGPLAIGLAAKWCIVSPNVEFTQRADSPVREPGPDKADWEAIDEALSTEMAISLRTRRIAEEVVEPMAQALLAPRESLHLAWTGCPTTLRVLVSEDAEPGTDHPTTEGETVLTLTRPARDGVLATTLDRSTGRQLGLIDAEARDVEAWLRKESLSSRPPNREQITPEAAKLPHLALGKVPIVDKQIEAAEKLLDLPDPEKRSVSPDRYKEASRSAGEALTRAQTALNQIEQLLKDYPEVLRTPPPGQTEVGAKPSSYAAKWRSMIQSRKDKIAKQRAKAEAFAAP